MKRVTRICTGTAIGLLAASAPLAAAPFATGTPLAAPKAALSSVILVDDCPRDQPRKDCVHGGNQPQANGGHRDHQPQQEQQQPQAEKPAPKPQAEKPAPKPQAEKPAPKPQAEKPAPKPQAEKPAPAEAKPAAKDNGGQFFKKKPAADAAGNAPEQPVPPKRRKPDAQDAKPNQPAAEKPAKGMEPAGQKAGSDNGGAPADKGNPDRRKKHRDNAGADQQSGGAQAPAVNGQDQQAQPDDNGGQFFKDRRKNDRKNRNGGQDNGGQDNGSQAGDRQGQNPPRQPGSDQNDQVDQGGDNGQAPIFDSQKQDRKHRRDGQQRGDRQGTQQPDLGPPPRDDRAAQRDVPRGDTESALREKGRRMQDNPDGDWRNRHRPSGADVLKQIGGRLIIQFGDQTFVQHDDGQRLRHGARDVYYDDLSDGRTRETIERPNGSRIVTIRDADGNIIQRSRIDADGREYVLSYVDEGRYQRDVDQWRDPGEDLPPIRRVPRDEYILDSEQVQSPDDYYDFLDKPPVERVTRLYSIGDVRRSARVRDIAPRIDLDTLNFDFGSAAISDSEAGKLQGVAEAMQKLLDRNPAETFLIEGHTDAVGSATANLALSDQRAEAVADVLTRMFDIPPENLVTQGYGEEFLKVDTQGPERANRRVAIRRITPLIAPVASNQ